MKQITDKGDYLEFYMPDKSDIRKESPHQIEAYQHLKHRYPMWLAWHTKNEGFKSYRTAEIDDQEGLLKGVVDIVILTGFQGCKYPFAAIEMKRVNKSGPGKASPVSKEQREFLSRVRALGGFAAVAYGSDMCRAAIEYMLSQH
ncbi:putative nuclease containing VRR-NUC domain [Pantoea phage vB_PagS_AAS23]|uniref:Putative nuclease containing VRR-NUC domain n=1 Tax=Pantoea phage vB_PagS_AAS23 TaxID=2499073 RepID=A0A3S9U7R9_9CAUD|nr:putative nuclease containing VRR-NUC domain [Pantoea phage vB_PagS_AAS23]AZS06346.1 putative nuclease containing VRR-NUC domain [Pantoea phage vB_PagS_AAS23]